MEIEIERERERERERRDERKKERKKERKRENKTYHFTVSCNAECDKVTKVVKSIGHESEGVSPHRQNDLRYTINKHDGTNTRVFT